MVVVSLRMKRLKKAILIVFVFVIIATGILIIKNMTMNSMKQKSSTELSTDSQMVLYFAKWGWLCEDECLKNDEITIPSEFNETYLLYNDLQLDQGFDLSKYKGKTVNRITYKIKNHPESEYAVGTLLLCDNVLIGADVTLLDTGEYQTFLNNINVMAE